MVTLKIQSGDDIIRAYFMNLGFTEKPALLTNVLAVSPKMGTS